MVSGLRPESGIVLTPEYEPGDAINHLRFCNSSVPARRLEARAASLK